MNAFYGATIAGLDIFVEWDTAASGWAVDHYDRNYALYAGPLTVQVSVQRKGQQHGKAVTQASAGDGGSQGD